MEPLKAPKTKKRQFLVRGGVFQLFVHKNIQPLQKLVCSFGTAKK
jgi:hypothetical protein